MAAPVVAGLAGLIREYYPQFSALEVKDIILKSVVKISHPAIVKDNNGNPQKIDFSKICIAGGIVNAYNALRLAETYGK